MTRRTSLEIIAEVLDICRQPQTQTRIMYASNLSFSGVRKYLMSLRTAGFLEFGQPRARYATTVRGMQFLRKWKELNDLIQDQNLVERKRSASPRVWTDESLAIFTLTHPSD